MYIQIVESRGNDENYEIGNGGNNVVSSSIVYGPAPQIPAFNTGFRSQKHSTYSDVFHTYILEWNENFMRMSVDLRTTAMLTDVYGAKGNDLFTRGDFPPTYQNGTTESVTVDIWEKPMGPFDQGAFIFWLFAFGFVFVERYLVLTM